MLKQLIDDELKLTMYRGIQFLPVKKPAALTIKTLLQLRSKIYASMAFAKMCLRGSWRPYSLADLQAYAAMMRNKQRGFYAFPRFNEALHVIGEPKKGRSK